jgi:NAD(P)-dependent dehydrogenase (short-subunit alcohol dehydrogenase family)
MRLDGKVALITGAAQGIGRGIAHRFAAEGARVVVADIQEERGQATTAELTAGGAQALFLLADVTDAAQVEAMVETAAGRWGRLDVLVNNAYWNHRGTAEEIELADWNKAQAAMVTAHYLGAKYAVPHLRRDGGGSIISISSVHGILAAAHSLAYETAKGAVLQLVKAMAVDFGPMGVRVNAICPGLIVHEGNSARGRRGADWQEDPFRAGLAQIDYPVRRWGTPLDIANAALFLASDEASFITGHALVVDGGMTVQLQDSHTQRVVEFLRPHRDRLAE